MAAIDLSKYGITGTTEIVHNPSYDVLFAEETKSDLEGYEKGHVSELGAVNVMTGVYTGRSPKDKYIVMDENSKNTVWWTSDEYKNDNHPASPEAWKALKEIATLEGYTEDAQAEFAALEKKLTHNLDRDLDHFAKDIKMLIADEIVQRYYYQRGTIIQQLKDDNDVRRAREILASPAEYKKILSPAATAVAMNR